MYCNVAQASNTVCSNAPAALQLTSDLFYL